MWISQVVYETWMTRLRKTRTNSEKNSNNDQQVKFLQIWVFPNKKNVQPRYDQKSISKEEKQNKLATVVSPIGTNDGGVQVHQDAWFHLSTLDAGKELTYEVKKKDNGVYVFVLEGDLKIGEIELSRRDGLGISESNSFIIHANATSEILLMEVPMM